MYKYIIKINYGYSEVKIVSFRVGCYSRFGGYGMLTIGKCTIQMLLL